MSTWKDVDEEKAQRKVLANCLVFLIEGLYVIANNTIESPPNTPDINTNILEGILPKLPVDVITIEQAMAALERSGPAIY
ncbi:hypothetical protein LTR09_006842 [Extremus antarcticus]|uniref:Uncharacterized protein n=1 Tax=Extremus antarcticus TaxID=702011 RepID=A0AAJ0DK40_9PEZI|nr:hypothetical protein LTR09_006842 [Extremus antarcticus]